MVPFQRLRMENSQVNNEKDSGICDRYEFGSICQNAQYSWEDLERSYRDDDGDIIDHEEYNKLYVLRVKWILEKVIPQNHPCFIDYETHYKIAEFLVEDCFSDFYIYDTEVDELYKFINELHNEYQA